MFLRTAFLRITAVVLCCLTAITIYSRPAFALDCKTYLNAFQDVVESAALGASTQTTANNKRDEFIRRTMVLAGDTELTNYFFLVAEGSAAWSSFNPLPPKGAYGYTKIDGWSYVATIFECVDTQKNKRGDQARKSDDSESINDKLGT